MSKYVSVVEKVHSKFLRSIAFFLYVVTVRTEVKCAAVVLTWASALKKTQQSPWSTDELAIPKSTQRRLQAR